MIPNFKPNLRVIAKASLLGFLVGVLICFFSLFVFFSYEGDNVIRVRKFPPGVKFVRFEGRLVDITVNNFTSVSKNDIGFTSRCKDKRQGELVGLNSGDKFWIFYSGNGNIPINDVDGAYKGTSAKNTKD